MSDEQKDLDVKDYWKPVDVPLQFELEKDQQVLTSIRLNTPKGADSRWFQPKIKFVDGDIELPGLKEGDSLMDLQAECAVRLSGLTMEELDKLEEPDFLEVIGAAFDFFTVPKELMRFHN